MTALGGTRYDLVLDDHRVSVVEVGAGLARYDVAGAHVTVAYPEDDLPPKGCGTTLVPWPNRLRGGSYTFDGTSQQLGLSEPDLGNAIHGLGRWARWGLVDATEQAVTLRLDVVPQKGYPFAVRVDKTYTLSYDDGLVVTMTARNLGDVRAPFGAGSHPYLSCRGHALDEVTLTLPAAEAIDTDDHQIPTGRHAVTADEDFRAGAPLGPRRFDQGFTGLVRHAGRATAEVSTPSGGARLWVDESYGFLQVFTVESLTSDGAGIAIEPMSCAADAFNSGDGLVVLEPGDTWTATWGVTASG